ncbi:MAG: lipid-A-disaccharide synthase [Bacteroidetes bacterium RIFCSPLOWO2_02_FULL_36_8]|nr:MAG: lipid-A-disaccharide synthase [Bacteroidetes bacterium RIFCSPLOWO2_02_FULL_36_8]
MPDAVILIDYPGFNLRMAPWLKQKGFNVFYYISPKIWAWNQSRISSIKKYIDKMIVIFPFEVEFYKRFSYQVYFFGNPVKEEVMNFKPDPEFRKKNNLTENPIVAVLPGSRKQEIQRHLSLILALQNDFPATQFVIAGLSAIDKNIYQKTLKNSAIKLLVDATYDLLYHANTAVVASGTATLETALFNIPQVVCYRVNPVSAWITRKVIKIPYVSLVNLLSAKECVKELLQEKFTPTGLRNELMRLLGDTEYRKKMTGEYQVLKEKLGPEGASARVAEMICQWTREGKTLKI